MSNIQQIFLDLDGPLIDGKERHYFCYKSILEKFGFIPLGIDEYWEKKRSLVNRNDLLRLSGAENIYDDFLAEWLLIIESPDALAFDKVQDGAKDKLFNWKKQGLNLVLVTMRNNKQALEVQLIALGLNTLLNTVLFSNRESGGVGKANAVRHHFENEGLAVQEEKSFWVGDTEADWEAAQSLGCSIVMVANGLRCEEYLNTLNNAQVVSSINLVDLTLPPSACNPPGKLNRP